jgi:hypothetical protein
MGFGVTKSRNLSIQVKLVLLVVLNVLAYAIAIAGLAAFLVLGDSHEQKQAGRAPATWPGAPAGGGPAVVEKAPHQAAPGTPALPTKFPGLIGYWPFDEEDANPQALDASGQNNPGTLRGAGRTQGIRGKALSLDGSSAYFDYGASPSFNFATNAPFTLACWVKTRGDSGTIISQRNQRDDGADIDLTLEGGRVAGVVRRNGGLIPVRVATRFAFNDEQWHHCALTRDAGNTIELFVDGVSQGKASGDAAAGPITTDLRALGSERRWVQERRLDFNGVKAYFSGSIDEFCIFNRALTGDEIKALAGR